MPLAENGLPPGRTFALRPLLSADVTPSIWLAHTRPDADPERYAFRPERFAGTPPGHDDARACRPPQRDPCAPPRDAVMLAERRPA